MVSDWEGILADFDLNSVDDVNVMRISGLMAHSDSGVFRVMLEKATAGTEPSSLIIDLTDLEFICSTGMSLLVQYQRMMDEAGRRMVTTGMSGTVRETVEICGIDKLISTSATVDAALDGLSAV